MEGFIFYCGDATRSSLYVNKPNKKIDTSEFGDSDCGEPLYEQRILIDFTPNEKEDNEFAQKKCVAFWNFINSMPELKDLRVLPEKPFSEVSETVKTFSSESESVKPEVHEAEKTAVSMLTHMQNKGYIDRTFEAKMPRSTCSLGSREYKFEEFKQPTKKKKRAPCCTRPTCPCGKSTSKPPSQLNTMIQNMEDWDAKHPKSMEPPGHPPTMQHCHLQRAYYSIPP